MNENLRSSVLFVCLGNICRSPTAQGVFEHLLIENKLAGSVRVDSCGTGDWHSGGSPDSRASAEALKRGYDLRQLRARQICPDDFHHFDYIVAMDRQNLADLQALSPAGYAGKLGLLLQYAPQLEISEVPDPYYGGEGGFTEVLDLIETACEGLLSEIRHARLA
jgi:low molecular weight protein-tyrosine phosphatase